MQRHRLHVTIPEDRRAVVEFPETIPTGEVELIVLVPSESPGTNEPQDLTDEGFPIFVLPPDAQPITSEMVQQALEEG